MGAFGPIGEARHDQGVPLVRVRLSRHESDRVVRVDPVGGPDMRTAEAPLAGQTLLVIGGSSGIGIATARRAHAEGPR
jgi:NADPH:quinone reductase-like Zn-dependent oxidoreductase